MPIGPYFRHLSISVDWLTSQARYVRVGFPRRTLPRFIWFTMPSLSQALLLEYLPSSHSAFQGHAAHTARWPAMLRPKGSWGACTPHGIIHSSTVLHGADLYTLRCCHIPPDCFTAQPGLQLLCPIRLSPGASSFRQAFPPHYFPTALPISRGLSRVQHGRRKRNDTGGVFISLPLPLSAAPQSLHRG